MYGVRTLTDVVPIRPEERERLRRVDMSIAARRFYRSVLGGRQVWPTNRRGSRSILCFLVGDTVIEVDPAPRVPPEAVEVAVDAPNELAERCWNAGYTVRVRDDEMEDESCSAFVITDPFGRSIALTPRAGHGLIDAAAG